MEATLNDRAVSHSHSIQKTTKSKYALFIEKLEFSYFAVISMTILIGSIVGGIAASIVLNNDAPIWQLGLVAAVAMANNTAAIGQAPTKWVVNLFILNIVVSTILILINIK